MQIFFSACYPFAPLRIFRSYAVHSYIQLFFQHLLTVCTLTDIQKETHISTSAANAKELTYIEEGWDSFKNDTRSFMYVKTINICLLKAFFIICLTIDTFFFLSRRLQRVLLVFVRRCCRNSRRDVKYCGRLWLFLKPSLTVVFNPKNHKSEQSTFHKHQILFSNSTSYPTQ